MLDGAVLLRFPGRCGGRTGRIAAKWLWDGGDGSGVELGA